MEEKNNAPVFHDDSPIESPDEDKFGHNVFAEHVAACISGIQNPDGSVIAIHGPWGSGKSSVINMVKHKVKKSDKSIAIVSFNCWRYRTEDGIIAGFFQEIYSELKSRRDIFKDILRNISDMGEQAIGLASRVGSGMDPVTGESLNIVISLFQRFMRYVRGEVTYIDVLQQKVGEKLKSKNQKILVVIDDIDRISPDEAIAIFRVIKSVGKIKNVVYLLAYDRSIVDSMIDDKYPSESGHYLEKIVQATFDLPQPERSALIRALDSIFKEIFEEKMPDVNSRRLRNVVYTHVVPEIKNLRDVYRLTNMLQVTFCAVKEDIDLVDFIILETLRLFRPKVYHQIRSHRDILTRLDEIMRGDKRKSQCEKLVNDILVSESVMLQKRLTQLLIEIFPRLDQDFKSSKSSNMQLWNERKRACSALHFDTYFRFSVSEEGISYAAFQEFCERVSDGKFVVDKLLGDLNKTVRHHGSKTSLLLDRIAQEPDSIDNDDVEQFLVTLYSVSDTLENSSDLVVDFGHIVDNLDRIIRISVNLLTDRFDKSDSSRIMLKACKEASLGLLMELCVVAFAKTDQENSDLVISNRWSLMTEDDTMTLRSMALSKVRNSIHDNSIFEHKYFDQILYVWYKISEKPEEVSDLFKYTFDSDRNVLRIVHKICASRIRSYDDNGISEEGYRRLKRVISMDHFIPRLKEIFEKHDLNESEKKIAEVIVNASNLYDNPDNSSIKADEPDSDEWDPF